LQGCIAVTREHKLALIVGFCLVLVLAVLFSDHLSKARAVEQSSELQVASSKQVGASTPGLKPPPSIIESETAAATPVRPPLPGIAETPAGVPQPVAVAATDGPTSQLPPIDPASVSVLPAGVRDAAPVPGPFEMVNDPGIARGDLPREIAEATEVVDSGAVSIPGMVDKPISRQPMRRHDVKEGERVFQIARSVYGDGMLWTRLREFNRGKIGEDGSVRAGVTLMLPPKDVLLGNAVLAPDAKVNPQPVAPVVQPGRTPSRPDTPRNARPGRDTRVAGGYTTYTVRKGDVLEDVARRTLGSPSRWRDIADANKGLDPNSLRIGQQIRIPAR
jgi:nucleoid-associated protein YgaU